jgi:NAD(P) transhydrogenase subunit alpha
MELIDPFVFRLSIFVLAIFVGYYVVWSVTPALHTPLMSVTNAISSVIVVGALIAVSVATTRTSVEHATASPIDANHVSIGGVSVEAPKSPSEPPEARQIGQAALDKAHSYAWISKILGFFALILASVNIFGGFLVTQRMLAMYRKKEKPSAPSGAAAGPK